MPDPSPGRVKQEPQYSVMTALSFLLLGLAVLTLVPHSASRTDFLGLRTLCSFVPVSTLLLAGLAAFTRAMRDSLYTRKPRA